MTWPQTGATHYHAQLGLPDKGRANKGLVVCYIVWLESMKEVGLRHSQGAWVWRDMVPCCGQAGYGDQLPQHPIETYLHNIVTFNTTVCLSGSTKLIFSNT